MRFSLLALVLPLASAFEVSRSSDYSPRNANTLVQRAVAAVDICAQVAINVPLSVRSCVVVSTGLSLDLSGLSLSALNTGISLGLYTCTTVSTNVLVGNNICACASGGVLDGDTIARLQALVTANGPAIQLLTTATNAVLNPYTTGTSGTLIGTIQNIVRGLLATEKTSCNLPTGAIAKCSSTPCSYDCPAGQSVCANQCAASCISGVPGRRSLNSEITDMRCPTGLSACALPSSVLGGRYGFECVDTRSDLESCGACAFPLPGRPLGRDCSLIPNAADVACANGSCVVQSCVSGWEVNDDATSCVSVISGEQSVVEEILGDAIWVQQKLSGATIQARKAALRKRQANAAKLRASKRRL